MTDQAADCTLDYVKLRFELNRQSL